MALRDIISFLKGYRRGEEDLVRLAQAPLSKEEGKLLSQKIVNREWRISQGTLKVGTQTFPTLTLSGKGSEELGKKVMQASYEDNYSRFSKDAFASFTESIAPNILDMDAVKQAVALQLFADERMHILLLGDPGTGKTEVLRSSAHLAPKSSMGLGSGTSGAGLSVAYQKGEPDLGLLPLADKGLCCIDELNLMKKDDRASLYNAMEKGFVTYDKGGKHEQFSADVRVLATANPKGDRFEGGTLEQLKKQLPFDPALLTRFHIVFLIHKPDTERFVDIARKIAKGTPKKPEGAEFLTAYVSHAEKVDVKFPPRLESRVTAAARKIKEHESELLIEVSPRIVKGIIGFAKASARMELRTTVDDGDVERVLAILGDSLGLTL